MIKPYNQEPWFHTLFDTKDQKLMCHFDGELVPKHLQEEESTLWGQQLLECWTRAVGQLVFAKVKCPHRPGDPRH